MTLTSSRSCDLEEVKCRFIVNIMKVKHLFKTYGCSKSGFLSDCRIPAARMS